MDFLRKLTSAAKQVAELGVADIGNGRGHFGLLKLTG